MGVECHLKRPLLPKASDDKDAVVLVGYFDSKVGCSVFFLPLSSLL